MASLLSPASVLGWISSTKVLCVLTVITQLQERAESERKSSCGKLTKNASVFTTHTRCRRISHTVTTFNVSE
jgi:hypothetical protein